MLWLGFTLAGTLDLMNGLHAYIPVIPVFTPSMDIGVYMTEKPWMAARPLVAWIYPFVVGLGYFPPREPVAVSLVFLLDVEGGASVPRSNWHLGNARSVSELSDCRFVDDFDGNCCVDGPSALEECASDSHSRQAGYE